MKHSFTISQGPYGEKAFLLNPALGDAEVTSRLAELDQLNSRYLWNKSLFGGLSAGAILAVITAVVIGGPFAVAYIPALLLGAGAIAAFVAGAVNEHRSLRLREGWVLAEDALNLDVLAGYRVSPQAADTDLWRAAQLMIRANETAKRARKGRKADKGLRFPAGALDALGDAEESVPFMYREVANILDPNGTDTSEWLLARVTP